ncbi:hypothetical protein ABPG75_001296 [Micractinium tetrahymenae]
MASAYPALVREGDTIIWSINGDRQALITIDKNTKVKLGKVFCSAAALVGCPYGSMFALGADGKTLERTEYVPLSDWDLPNAPDFNTRTNAELVDAGLAHQALSAEDIEAMKAEGKAGADIVAALAANSATFANKTEFSQEKYKKKKAKKYIQVGTVRRPTAAAVCEAYFANSPSRTGYLRVDALALLLSLANVGPHARVLVVESCGGLVSAAALERLCAGSAGCVVSAWAGGPGANRPALDAWRHMNFSGEQRSALRFAPLHALLGEARRTQQAQQGQQAEEPAAVPQQQQQSTAVDGQQAAAEQPAEQQQQQQQQQEGEQQQQPGQPAAGEGGEPMEAQDGAAAAAEHAQQAEQQAQAPQGAQAQQPRQAHGAPFNCCILAASALSPLALIRHVLPLLAPSASLAVFSPWQHPLAEALDALRGQGEAANLALQEAWWREMQVLPLRSHPNMNMNHGGGYILSGTVLAPSARKQQQQQQQQQQPKQANQQQPNGKRQRR